MLLSNILVYYFILDFWAFGVLAEQNKTFKDDPGSCCMFMTFHRLNDYFEKQSADQ